MYASGGYRVSFYMICALDDLCNAYSADSGRLRHVGDEFYMEMQYHCQPSASMR